MQDEMADFEGSLEMLMKAVKGWKVMVESRDDGKTARDGFMLGGCGEVPSNVLYRLGRCSEEKGDLAAAEKFYTWSMEVVVGDGHSRENLRFVVGWAQRDCRKLRRAYKRCKGKRKRWIDVGGGGGVEDKEFETAMEEEMAFTARAYMLHSRLLKYGKLMLEMMEQGLSDVHQSKKIVTEFCSVVERGWEGRMLCKFGGRDAWSGLI